MKRSKKEFRKVVGGKQAVAETPQADGRPADGYPEDRQKGHDGGDATLGPKILER